MKAFLRTGVWLMAAAVIALAGCAEVRGSLRRVTDGSEAGVSDHDARLAERLYGEALALKGDAAAAAKRLGEAAELGHGAAAYELGIAYNEGRGVPRDLEAGARWINAAAGRGEPRAQYIIGTTYFAGAGVAKDYPKALEFLAPAAVAGHPRAQYLLAKAFANGWGVARDAAWAARWYGKAARRGHVAAQFDYGVILSAGLGLPGDDVAAYRWLTLALAGGHPVAKRARTALARRMTEAGIQRAEAGAAGFAAGTNPDFADPPTVMFVQHRLAGLGHPAGPVDGVMGERTRAAIRAFQAASGVKEGGEVTSALLTRLLEAGGGG